MTTRRVVTCAIAMMAIGALLWMSGGSGVADPGVGRFDRLTLHNMTDRQVPVSIQLMQKVEGQYQEALSALLTAPAGGSAGLVTLQNFDPEITRVVCTADGKVKTLTAVSGKWLRAATFWLGKEADGTEVKKLYGEGIQNDRSVVATE